MAEETNKVEPVFKGIDETGMDFWYEDNVNKLKYWFYRSSNIGTITPTDPTNPDGWDEDDYGDNVPSGGTDDGWDESDYDVNDNGQNNNDDNNQEEDDVPTIEEV